MIGLETPGSSPVSGDLMRAHGLEGLETFGVRTGFGSLNRGLTITNTTIVLPHYDIMHQRRGPAVSQESQTYRGG